jgi:BirA family biotin operon repressor/biotin-[acetyl-CoA-carboxylase] ligase
VFEIRAYRETDSTNDDAAALLGHTGRHGHVLLADYQHAGRGRHARAWVAPPGSSLLFTTILPRPVASDALWAVTFWTALAVATGIEAATGLRAQLQWPNDLLLEGRKMCGILCVSRVLGRQAWIGCGTGINVYRPAADPALDALAPPPAFLSDFAPQVERGSVLDAILAAYANSLDALDDPRRIARAWEARADLDGTPYRLLVDGTGEPFDATARRIGTDGALVVESDGIERSVSLADARVIRA